MLAHRALDRVLEGDQRAVGLAPLDRDDRVVDRGRAQRLELRAAVAASRERVLGEGPRRSEVGDLHVAALYSNLTV